MTESDKRPLAVFDLDNTLADTAHRQRFLERGPRDWDAFFAAAPEDPPIPEGIALVLERAEECEIRYLTGRPERCRRDTLAWLAAQGLPEGRVYMRRNDDRRPARRTKLEILKRLMRHPRDPGPGGRRRVGLRGRRTGRIHRRTGTLDRPFRGAGGGAGAGGADLRAVSRTRPGGSRP